MTILADMTTSTFTIEPPTTTEFGDHESLLIPAQDKSAAKYMSSNLMIIFIIFILN